MKFQIGDRVLVNYYDVVNEPATIIAVDARDNTYWCVFDRGSKSEQASNHRIPYAEEILEPQWMSEEELQPL